MFGHQLLMPVPDVDLETLERLQRAHMTAVPFENLHVFHRRGVSTSTEWSIPKIVGDRRGGWCFELNGAFSELLRALGFSVTRLAAGVLLDGGTPPDEPDHLTVRVDLDGPYLVDVGFGDSFIRPLRLDSTEAQDGGDRAYRFTSEDDYTILESRGDAGWEPRFRFDHTGHEMADFEPRSTYLQTEPGLRWTEAPFATRLLNGGPDRVWLLRDRLKRRKGGKTSVEPVAPEEWDETLHAWFGLYP